MEFPKLRESLCLRSGLGRPILMKLFDPLHLISDFDDYVLSMHSNEPSFVRLAMKIHDKLTLGCLMPKMNGSATILKPQLYLLRVGV